MVAEIAIILTCIALFFVQMVDVWHRYFNEETLIAIKEESRDSLQMPTLTICPKNAYKTLPTNSSPALIKANGYKAEDIFLNLDYLQNSSKYVITETPARFYVMCQTVTFIHEQKDQDYSFLFQLSTDTDYELYPGEPGEEFWHSLGIVVYDFVSVPILANSSKGIGSLDVIIRKEVTHQLSSKSTTKCQEGVTAEDFAGCSAEELSRRFLKMGNCTSYLHQDIDPKDKLPLCQTPEEHFVTVELLIRLLKDIVASNHCKRICARSKFITTTIEYNENVIPFGKYWLAVFYGSFNVEHKYEKYVYDFGTALVAVGGSMGLFLGLSCQSIALSMLDLVKKRCN